MKNKFLYTCSSNIDNQILDSIKSKEDVVAVSLSIKASHAGKVNGNYVFYTPRGMRGGVTTLTVPFKKHLQYLHRGDAVGVIHDASYLDYTEQYSDAFKKLAHRIEDATTPQALVSSVKELMKHPEYKGSDYKGLGVIQVNAELFDAALIQDLASGANKGKVSIGGSSRRAYCSVCASLFTKDHEHQRGKNYNGEACFAIYDTMELDHIGFVPDPADTATETVIISDSLEDMNSSVTINDFKIQDNTQGHIMNIEQLKQFAKDVNNLVNIAGLTEIQKDSLKEAYNTEKKHARGSGYLLSEDKLLPVNTKTNTAITYKAIEQLTDSTEKQVLLDLLAPHLAKFFKEEDITEYLTELGKDDVEKALTKDASDIVSEEQTKIDAANEEIEKVAKEQTTFDFSPEGLEQLVTSVVEKTIAASQPKQEETKIQDSVEYSILVANNKQLTEDIEAIALVNAELTNKYKEAIISQILTLKGVSRDSEYAERLASRDLDSLSTTLQDVEFDLLYTNKVTATPTEEASKVNTEEVVAENNESQAVQDSQQAIVAEAEEEKELEKTELKDSLTNLNVEEKAEVKDNISDLELIRKEGLASYLRTRKTNK